MHLIEEMGFALLFTLALSVDAFASSLAYGASKIKIPIYTNILINLLCTITFAVSFFFGDVISKFIPQSFTKYFACSLLLLIGIYKLFSSIFKIWLTRQKGTREVNFKIFKTHIILKIFQNCLSADQNNDKILSIKEGVLLSLALSVDSLGVGLGAGLGEIRIWLACIFCFIIGVLAVFIGDKIGRIVSNKTKLDLGFISGLILICLGIFKFF